METLKTSEDWQKLCHVEIYDPDGWDRRNFQFSWYEELITREEFEKRLAPSTVMFNVKNLSNIWKDTDDIVGRKMYLEISARRTGKTRRLVKAVKEHLDSGGEAIVVAPYMKYFEFMELPSHPNLHTLSDWHLKEPTPEKLQDIKFFNPRWFFDEFDYIENVQKHLDGYYVTTPKFMRNILEMSEEEIKADSLFSLLKLNDREYVAYTLDTDIIKDSGGDPWPEGAIHTELFGNFF